MADRRSLPVPDGLEGERLDAALSRLFGLSRTRAAELIVAGDVLVDGSTAAKSDRLHGGAWLEVTLPPPPTTPMPVAEPVPGMHIVYEDDDIVVVNKPVGVAAHPTTGWTGPTVIGGLLGAGHRVATSGAAERQGIVHRLDANTTGAMVIAKSEHAYSHLKRAFKERTVDKRYHALVQGHPDPHRGTVDAPIDRHPVGDGRWAVVAGARSRSPTTTRSRPSARRRCWTSNWRRAGPTRSGSTCRRCATRASATCCTGPTRPWPRGWA